ncbi:MAG: hypothetical protein ACOC34_02665 [Thermotogota bacterium]
MKIRNFTGIMIIILWITFVYANNNDTLPTFSFESYDGAVINHENILNTRVSLILYGTPDALTNNRKHLDLVLEWVKLTDKN